MEHAFMSADVVSKTELYFCEGTSDKEYVATIVKEGGGWRVVCHYGRRGYSLKTTDKGFYVSLVGAQIQYNKVVIEKTSKGYIVKSVDKSLKEKIVDTLEKKPEGMTDEQIQTHLASERTSSEDERAKALARLKAACAN
jgi:hypothetical protein